MMRARDAWFTEERVVRFSQAMVIALVIAGVGWLVTMRDLMVGPDRALGGDFLGVYAAGVLAREGTPAKAYDLAAIVEVEHKVMPQSGFVLPWPYPPVFQVVALPLAHLPYVWAYGLWAGLLLILYVVAWRGVFGGGTAPFWVAMGASGVHANVMLGQNGLLSAVLVAAGLLALRTRPLLAGMAIGALCYKPHIGLPIGLILLGAGQWRAVTGAALSAALLCLLSAAMLGLDVWRAFLDNGAATHALLQRADLPLNKIGTVFSLARLLGAGLTPALVLQGIVAVAALALAIRAWRRPGDMNAKLALAAATVPLVSPYMFDYDLVILVLPICLLLADGFRNGWLPGMRPILMAAWIAPAIAIYIADATHIQSLALTGIALFWAAWWRCASNATSVSDASPEETTTAPWGWSLRRALWVEPAPKAGD